MEVLGYLDEHIMCRMQPRVDLVELELLDEYDDTDNSYSRLVDRGFIEVCKSLRRRHRETEEKLNKRKEQVVLHTLSSQSLSPPPSFKLVNLFLSV
jgi:hypothetical protein